MRAALAELYDNHAVKTMRMDSGGTLNGVMLSAGLVSEISLLVHPLLVVGSPDVKSFLITHQRGGGLLWTRYRAIPG